MGTDTVTATYLDAFEAWAAAARRYGRIDQPGSLEAYRVLWMSLLKWAVAQSPAVTLDAMTAGDLARFIARRDTPESTGVEPSPRHVWRLLQLIDRVQCHRRPPAGGSPNRAAYLLLMSRDDWRHANAAHKDPPPEHLNASQARALVNHLSRARPRGGRPAVVASWQELRNLTAVALHLGAGVTPAELRALQLGDVVSHGGPRSGLPWKLRVPSLGDSPARETPIAPWAGQILRWWLEARLQHAIAGPQLLPSTRSGKPWSKVSHYLAVRDVIAAAGLGDAAAVGGSFRLRHTFALRQLRRGSAGEDVARWLGVEMAEIERYRRVVFEPLPDVA